MQTRAVAFDEATAQEYCDQIFEGAEFPPLEVAQVKDKFYLWDGFHRFEAYKRLERRKIPVSITKVASKEAALELALGANQKHGLRLTNADKRHKVELAFGMWPKVSDNEIAKKTGVSQPFVSKLKKEIAYNGYKLSPNQDATPSEPTALQPPVQTKEVTQRTRSGKVKTFPMKTASIGKGKPQIPAQPTREQLEDEAVKLFENMLGEIITRTNKIAGFVDKHGIRPADVISPKLRLDIGTVKIFLSVYCQDALEEQPASQGVLRLAQA
jgi:hypothetical protein